MHDLILAKQISDLVKSLMAKHEIENLKGVSIEVGDVSGIHNHAQGEEHSHEDIEISNLKFHLKNFYPETKFKIDRKSFEGWKLIDMEGE